MEDVVHGVFLLLGLVTVGCVLLITVYLILSGLPAITKIGLGNFLFGMEWASTASDPKYGILPFILTSVYGTCGAILLGVPVGFLTAVFLSKMAPKKLRSVMESAVSLLAGIPSVVYGLVGMLVLVPGIRKLFHVPDGASLLAALVVFMIVYVLYKGLPYVTWHLISTKPSYITGAIGILPDICNTMQILLASLLIVLPLGVGAAVYLTEYAQNKKLVAAIEYAAETLSGIPSIIYGLVGMLFFCEFLGMQTSLLAGALTLVIMNLPTVLRTTQESLRTVPQSYREGAFGLGAGKWRVVRTVVLPGCIDGIVTGCILSAGRILGESAALLFTAGFAHTLNKFVIGLASPGATLTVALYAYAKEEGEFDVAFAIAAILMILTLLINLAAGIVGKQIQKRSQQ